jgi:hypothetical protein
MARLLKKYWAEHEESPILMQFENSCEKAISVNKQHGILIRADAQIISNVYAAVWNGQEIRKKLFLHDEEFVYQEVRSDSIVVKAVGNIGGEKDRLRNAGFVLFGRRFYGNALIIPDEERDSPKMTPREIAHVIRFFRPEES